MKIEPMTREDQTAAMEAFMDWMHSQDIHPGHATWLMMTLSGALTAAIADDQIDLDIGVGLLAGELKRSAKAAFRKKTRGE